MSVIPTIKRDFLENLAKDGKRMDGRKFNEFRKASIEPGVISRAEGSARVMLGKTQIICGIKMDLGDPYPDSPDSGVMTTAAELIPMASPNFEAGPPREDAIELARVVDRGIRESGVIKTDELCIVSGKKIWIVFIDIHIIDYDGNLFDACSLAALAALLNTKVPIERLKDKLEKAAADIPEVAEYLKAHGEDYPLPVSVPPISCTWVKIGDSVMIDPALDEDLIADVRLTVATDEKGDIRAMQKGLNGSFTSEEIKNVIKESFVNGTNIREQLYKDTGK